MLICFFGVNAMGQNLDTIPYFSTDSMPNAGIYLPAPPDTCSQLFIDDFQQWLWGVGQIHASHYAWTASKLGIPVQRRPHVRHV